MAFVGIATIVGIGEVVVKFAVISGSKKKLGFIKVLIPSKFYRRDKDVILSGSCIK